MNLRGTSHETNLYVVKEYRESLLGRMDATALGILRLPPNGNPPPKGEAASNSQQEVIAAQAKTTPSQRGDGIVKEHREALLERTGAMALGSLRCTPKGNPHPKGEAASNRQQEETASQASTTSSQHGDRSSPKGDPVTPTMQSAVLSPLGRWCRGETSEDHRQIF